MTTYSVFRVECRPHVSGQSCHWADCKHSYLATFESRREAIAHARATNRPAWVFRDNLKTGLGTLVASVNEVSGGRSMTQTRQTETQRGPCPHHPGSWFRCTKCLQEKRGKCRCCGGVEDCDPQCNGYDPKPDAAPRIVAECCPHDRLRPKYDCPACALEERETAGAVLSA